MAQTRLSDGNASSKANNNTSNETRDERCCLRRHRPRTSTSDILPSSHKMPFSSSSSFCISSTARLFFVNPFCTSFYSYSFFSYCSLLILLFSLLIFIFALVLAYYIRMIPVEKYGPLLLEYDPWSHWRAAVYMEKYGWHSFLHWFDTDTWYPLGRPMGTTAYPGLPALAIFCLRVWEYVDNVGGMSWLRVLLSSSSSSWRSCSPRDAVSFFISTMHSLFLAPVSSLSAEVWKEFSSVTPLGVEVRRERCEREEIPCARFPPPLPASSSSSSPPEQRGRWVWPAAIADILPSFLPSSVSIPMEEEPKKKWESHTTNPYNNNNSTRGTVNDEEDDVVKLVHNKEGSTAPPSSQPQPHHSSFPLPPLHPWEWEVYPSRGSDGYFYYYPFSFSSFNSTSSIRQGRGFPSPSLDRVAVYLPVWGGVLSTIVASLITWDLMRVTVWRWWHHSTNPVFSLSSSSAVSCCLSSSSNICPISPVSPPPPVVAVAAAAAAAASTTAILYCILPAHLMRSVAGSFDNECAAVPAMLITFWCWLRAIEDAPSLFSRLEKGMRRKRKVDDDEDEDSSMGGGGKCRETKGKAKHTPPPKGGRRSPTPFSSRSCTLHVLSWGVLAGCSYGVLIAMWGGFIYTLNLLAIHAISTAFLEWWEWRRCRGHREDDGKDNDGRGGREGGGGLRPRLHTWMDARTTTTTTTTTATPASSLLYHEVKHRKQTQQQQQERWGRRRRYYHPSHRWWAAYSACFLVGTSFALLWVPPIYDPMTPLTSVDQVTGLTAWLGLTAWRVWWSLSDNANHHRNVDTSFSGSASSSWRCHPLFLRWNWARRRQEQWMYDLNSSEGADAHHASRGIRWKNRLIVLLRCVIFLLLPALFLCLLSIVFLFVLSHLLMMRVVKVLLHASTRSGRRLGVSLYQGWMPWMKKVGLFAPTTAKRADQEGGGGGSGIPSLHWQDDGGNHWLFSGDPLVDSIAENRSSNWDDFYFYIGKWVGIGWGVGGMILLWQCWGKEWLKWMWRERRRRKKKMMKMTSKEGGWMESSLLTSKKQQQLGGGEEKMSQPREVTRTSEGGGKEGKGGGEWEKESFFRNTNVGAKTRHPSLSLPPGSRNRSAHYDYYYLSLPPSSTHVFMLLYSATIAVFSRQMGRLLPLAAPAACILCGYVVGNGVAILLMKGMKISERRGREHGMLNSSFSSLSSSSIAKGLEMARRKREKGSKINQKNEHKRKPIPIILRFSAFLSFLVGFLLFRLLVALLFVLSFCSLFFSSSCWKEGTIRNSFLLENSKAAMTFGVPVIVEDAFYTGGDGAEASPPSTSSSSASFSFPSPPPPPERMLLKDRLDALLWLRAHTPENSRVLGWWEHGFHLNSIANRTSFIDGNTWNTPHIATVARLLLAPAEEAHALIRHVADYIFLLAGEEKNDLLKAVHMARIANSIYPDLCGVKDPLCEEFFHYAPSSPPPPPSSSASLSPPKRYRLHYSLLAQLYAHDLGLSHIPPLPTHLFEEVFQSSFGMVRIFKVVGANKSSQEWVETHRQCKNKRREGGKQKDPDGILRSALSNTTKTSVSDKSTTLKDQGEGKREEAKKDWLWWRKRRGDEGWVCWGTYPPTPEWTKLLQQRGDYPHGNDFLPLK